MKNLLAFLNLGVTIITTTAATTLTIMLLLSTASRTCLVRGFVPSSVRTLRATATKHNSIGRLYYTTDPVKAQLSYFSKLQEEYQLITPTEDHLELRDKQRLVCIGDVHGDVHCLKEFLEISQVYNELQGWIGGDTILVQCGDVLDRGSTELACFSLLSRLSHQAQEQGGRVIVLWGNHEALNAAGLFHYTTGDAEYEENVGLSLDESLQTNRWRLQFAGNQPARWATYEPGGLFAITLLANMKVAVQVGKTVCVHAGLKKEHLDKWGGLKGINKMAHDYIQQAHHGCNNNIGAYETVDQVMEEAQHRAKSAKLPPCLGGGVGGDTPVWMRDYSSPANYPSTAVIMMDDVLNALQADRMVMGHTVQNQINAALHGKAWRIDVGASSGVMSGTPEVLEVVRNGDQEIVSVLTRAQGRVPAAERLVDTPVASSVPSEFIVGVL